MPTLFDPYSLKSVTLRNRIAVSPMCQYMATDGLVNEFLTRMQLNYVTEGCTVLRISLTSETAERDRDFIDKLSDIYLLKLLIWYLIFA